MKVSAADKAVAIVGVGAIMPDAPNAPRFWQNIKDGRDSISDVPRDRWNPDLYYDPDPKVPDKAYSKIGGWVQDWDWDPLKWRLPIPPNSRESLWTTAPELSRHAERLKIVRRGISGSHAEFVTVDACVSCSIPVP